MQVGRVARSVLVAASILAGVVAAGAVASPGGPPSASANQTERAKALAAEVRHADTKKQRSAALRDVMRAVNIGVYKPNGARILQGDESGRNDFYLYNFELDIMGSSLARNSQTSVDNLAQGLSSLATDGQTIDGSTLQTILVDGVQSAEQNPSAPQSLVPLLVRELGLHHQHKYDLAQGISTDKPTLDALQRFLITADVNLTLLRQIRQQSPASAPNAQASGHPCDSDFAGGVGEFSKFGKWGAGFVKKLSAPLKLAGVIIDGLQGSVLAFSVQVEGIGKYRVHADMGYPGHPAGKFEVGLRVKMLDDLGKILVKCGKLAGAELPPKGPIEGVRVGWSRPEDDIYGSELDDWGEVTCPKVGCQKTDSNGESLIKFQAGSYKAHYGNGVLALGHFDGVAHYLTRFGNVIGVVDEYLVPKDYTPHWEVLFQPCAPRTKRC
jgi:hypothetical protein